MSAAKEQGSPDELLRAIESQDRFMSYLSHEIRGGFNTVVLMLEVIRRDLRKRGPGFEMLSSDVDALLQSVRETVGSMDRALLSDRIRRGRIEPTMEPVNLKHILEDAAKGADKLKGNRPIQIHVKAPDDAVVKTDRIYLGKALENLLENAVAHATQWVEIEASVSGAGWQIAVRDDGAGIDPERLRWLLDVTRMPDSKNKGVGLVATNQIVNRLLGGRLEAESEMKKGTVCRIVLP